MASAPDYTLDCEEPHYPANAAWVAHAAIAFNLARATSTAAGQHAARWATLRRRLLHVPARIATSGRRLTLHLPTGWPWEQAWQTLWGTSNSSTGPPVPVTP